MKYNPDSVYNAPDFTLEFVNDEKKTHLKNNRDVSFDFTLKQNDRIFDNSLVKLSCKIVHNILFDAQTDVLAPDFNVISNL